MRSFSWPDEMSAEASHRIWIRTASALDVEGLSEHFRTLSHPSRYNRFMGAVGNFSKIAFDCLVHGRKADRFTLVAELRRTGAGLHYRRGKLRLRQRSEVRGVRDFGVRSLAEPGARVSVAMRGAMPCPQPRPFRVVRRNLEGQRSNEKPGAQGRLCFHAFAGLARGAVLTRSCRVGLQSRPAAAGVRMVDAEPAAVGHSVTISPEPPSSFGKSLSLGNPSRIGSTVSE